MTTATRRAEVVTADERFGEQFREYLEDLDYDVQVRRQVGPTVLLGVDIIVYHVSPDAARAERRSRARPQSSAVAGAPRYWLDAVHQLSERAPETPILVAVPAGGDEADKALDSGATDVIDSTVTPKIFRRRIQMLEAYANASSPRTPSAGSPAALRKGTYARRSGPGVLNVPLPELRNGRSGRIDARLVADYLGVSLRQLADAMQLPYGRVHKTPDAARLQDAIAPIARILELADAAFGTREAVLMWLNRPLHELENDSPLSVMLAGEAGAVETLLENARAGIPG
ncbi:MAG: DUF2384 domain-containing protein [Gemmatimonadetes bacterium]|nr:DUF2384 domain-containing protein [Gemmatimonadota bacterium]